METQKPVILGIFVNSHIKAVRDKKGEDGVKELEKRYGKPLRFKNTDKIPVREEVRIIECALDLLSDTPPSPQMRVFEAGRLHFRNFTATPLGKIIFSKFRTNIKMLLMQASNIAGHVFEGVTFSSHEAGSNAVEIIMENNDYPLDHFKGLFYEWTLFSGHKGNVEATELAPNKYRYLVRWE